MIIRNITHRIVTQTLPLGLITCKDYDQTSGEYDWRLAVKAVLISIE